ncbi:MAG: AbrB/MazE/SpoVT family DNA-binding domain-containing protein, partial [SAR324 cluster bacterium]|nr:AbrB/MazE/SpoVT family DNA-binding domain-containing protein [SAR324 cluster bacterium]
MLKVKVTQVGNSMGIILPKEALKKLKAEKGDMLYMVEKSEGYTLTAYQQDFEDQIKVAEGIMK